MAGATSTTRHRPEAVRWKQIEDSTASGLRRLHTSVPGARATATASRRGGRGCPPHGRRRGGGLRPYRVLCGSEADGGELRAGLRCSCYVRDCGRRPACSPFIVEE